MRKKYKMVSIDSSTKKTGYAYWENGKLVECGLIDESREKDAEIRLENMCIAIVQILEKYMPETVCIEMTVVQRNAATQRVLSEIVGVVRGWTLCRYAEFVRLRPSEWRKWAKGETSCPSKRDEAKAWAVSRVRELCPELKLPSDDVAEAILIGFSRIQFMNSLKTSRKDNNIG